jgi:integrase
MATWKKVGEHLVRHSGGTIYLRARVSGKPIRVSLGTDDLRIAKIARDARLAAIREAAEASDAKQPRTIGDFLDLVESRAVLPHLKPATIRNYRYTFSTLRSSMDVRRKGQGYTEAEASAWWRGYAKSGCRQKANLALTMAKRVGECLRESGLTAGNPFGRLKRVALRKKEIKIPTDAELRAVIASIASQGLRCSVEASRMVAVLAYSGLRIGELQSVLWRDVTSQWLVVTGGVAGTKNGKVRRVPINPRLQSVLAEMGWDAVTGAPPDGLSEDSPLFTIVSPRGALRGACSRLKLGYIHPHMLRHCFASFAIEQGVDIPTVSRWLGHSDGGALAMKTYGHLRDDHSLRMAASLR